MWGEADSAGPRASASVAGEMTDGRVMDMRWVTARVARPVAWSFTPGARPVTVHAEMETASGVPAGDAAVQETESYSTVVDKLRTWGKRDDASR